MKANRIEIKNADDYNAVCEDILDEWLDDLMNKKGMTRPPTEEDYYAFEMGEDELSFMYTQQAM